MRRKEPPAHEPSNPQHAGEIMSFLCWICGYKDGRPIPVSIFLRRRRKAEASQDLYINEGYTSTHPNLDFKMPQVLIGVLVQASSATNPKSTNSQKPACTTPWGKEPETRRVETETVRVPERGQDTVLYVKALLSILLVVAKDMDYM